MPPPHRTSPPPPPPPPPPEDPIVAGEAEAIGAASTAMMAAASTLISEMFVIATQRMQEATKDRLPADSPVQKSTAAMIAQLQAQLNRALGVTPRDGLPPDGEPKP